ncbi:hypothetical protein NQ318_013294 [Aromia moschata]|uniref:Peptidase C1A papain C-terminal domain-containing protein n=1 Tax=Aromia moschata TaxID=1265417 RepID=A0AAV8XYI2_9CUCU|nr:hypothetical protein NQ318_013294 [Aromia moschata]
MKLLICFFIVAVSCALASVKLHPLSDEFVAHINSKKPTWVAGRNFDINTPMSFLRSLTGTVRSNLTRVLMKKLHNLEDVDIPESFDAREQWPDCPSIGHITDQASCGSCWALGAVEAMTDRICISSEGKTQTSVSAEDLLSCCTYCGKGCDGGDPAMAWLYWTIDGLVSGGDYNTTNGCKSYSIAPCAHHVESDRPSCTGIDTPTPSCVQQCDAASSLSYSSDVSFGDTVYTVDDDEKQIQEGNFNEWARVYQHVSGDLAGGHAVKIIGWGTENDTPYWLVANSWNSDWGDEGYFKILRGEDHMGIESYIVGGSPKLS